MEHSPEFWYTTILFALTVIGALLAAVKLVFKIGRFTEVLDSNLEASTETLMFVKGIDARLIAVEAEYVKEDDFNELDKRVLKMETKHEMIHGKKED